MVEFEMIKEISIIIKGLIEGVLAVKEAKESIPLFNALQLPGNIIKWGKYSFFLAMGLWMWLEHKNEMKPPKDNKKTPKKQNKKE